MHLRSELKKQFQKKLNGAEEAYHSGYQRLTELVKSLSPLQLLASFTSAYMFEFVRNHKEIAENDAKLGEIHIDLLQSLTIEFHKSESTNEAPSEESIEELCGLILSLPVNYHLKRLSRIQVEDDIDADDQAFAAEMHSMVTQFRRNWGYLDDVIEFLREILEPIAEQIYEKTKIKLDILTKLIEYICSRMIDPEPLSSLHKKLRSKKVSKNDVLKHLLLSEGIENIVDIYTVNTCVMSEALGESTEDIFFLMEKISLAFGDLKSNTRDYMIDNPIWTKPFVRLDANRYFISSIHLLSTNVFDIINELLKDFGGSLEKFNKRVQFYAEEKLKSILQHAFPQSEVYRGNYIHQKRFHDSENDIILKYGDIVAIFECKSARLREPARRGVSGAVKNFYKRNIFKGHAQATGVPTIRRTQLRCVLRPVQRPLG